MNFISFTPLPQVISSHYGGSGWRPDYVHWDGVLGGRDKERTFGSQITNDSAVCHGAHGHTRSIQHRPAIAHGQWWGAIQPFNHSTSADLLPCWMMLAGDSPRGKWCEGCEFHEFHPVWSPGECQSGVPGFFGTLWATDHTKLVEL